MQNWQNKSKVANSFSKMVAHRDKNKLQEKKRKDYIELLKKPRSKEYLMFFNKKVELEKKICDIQEEIDKLEREIGELPEEVKEVEINNQEAESKAKTQEPKWWETEEESQEVKEENKGGKTTSKWWEAEEEGQEENKGSQTTSKWWETEEESRLTETKPSWMNASFSNKEETKKQMEKLERKQELQRQQEQLLEEWEEASRQFEAQLPVENVVGAVYCGWFTRLLKRWGFISVPGTAYHSPQELLDITQPDSEKVAERWLKGDQALMETRAILVEIYMDVLCLVYSDGNVDVLEE